MHKPTRGWPPASLLVVDTETTIDPSQRFLFGSYRFYRVYWQPKPPHTRRLAPWEPEPPYLACTEEGIVFADDLAERDPKGYAVLEQYVREHRPAVDRELPGSAFTLRLYSRQEFLEQVFYPAVHEAQALLACFNFPFDLSRLAVRWGKRTREPYAGGVRLYLSQWQAPDGSWKPDRYKPDVGIKQIDSKRALKGFLASEDPDPHDLEDGKTFRGHFLDLRTLAFALTNESHRLETACEAFGVPYTKRPVEHGHITPEYVTYNREDVEASTALFAAVAGEYGRHPIDLQITKVYSPASIGKAYLRALGVRPPLERQRRFPKEVLGYAMAAYYGGRAECRIRRIPVPVSYLDFASMYPTVCALLDLWQLLTCARVDVVETDPAEVEHWLNGLSPDTCLDPGTWRDLAGLVLLEPVDDVLPARARYDEPSRTGWGIGVNRLTSREPMWYALPDAAASALLTGRAPKVLRALRFVPHGRARELRPLKLRGAVKIDPRSQDFFRAIVQARRAREAEFGDAGEAKRNPLVAFLKVLANATSYGIFAEQNRKETGTADTTIVAAYGLRQFTTPVPTPEEPGEYFFSPFACLIAAGARLMLALLERLITDAGGCYAFCDTDSMAVVSNLEGGRIPCPGGLHRLPDGHEAVLALSYEQVEEIRQRFTSLNPYDPNLAGGSILELEPENLDLDSGARRELWCYAISAKRYALFNLEPENPSSAASENTKAHVSPANRKKIGDLNELRENPPSSQKIGVGSVPVAQPILRKRSEHGLGHLLNPLDPDEDNRDWITALWQGTLTTAALGLPATAPAWLDRIACSRLGISSPTLLNPFKELNRGRSYADSIKPFGFLLLAHVAPLGHPIGANPERFALIAPYNRDPRQWTKLRWSNPHEPRPTRYRVTTAGLLGGRGVARVKSYRDVLDDYRDHPEAKSLGPNSAPCDRQTCGLLARRRITARSITHVGKEANLLEEIEAGLIHDEEAALTEYHDPAADEFATLVVPSLDGHPLERIAATTGLAASTIRRTLRDPGQARERTKVTLQRFAHEHAKGAHLAWGIDRPRDPLSCLASYLAERDARAVPIEDVLATIRALRPVVDLPPRTLRRLLAGGTRITRERAAYLTDVAERAATRQLEGWGMTVPDEAAQAISAFRAEATRRATSRRTCAFDGCDRFPRPRSAYCSEAHRKRAARLTGSPDR